MVKYWKEYGSGNTNRIADRLKGNKQLYTSVLS